MNDKPVLVLKIGGNQVEDEAFLAGFAVAVQELSERYAVIVIHGGGKEIADLHAKLGVAFETVEGLRITSEKSLTTVSWLTWKRGRSTVAVMSSIRLIR